MAILIPKHKVRTYLTTYRQDYIDPRSKRPELLQYGHAKGAWVLDPRECDCGVFEPPEPEPEPISPTCDKVEWTGIAPMGKLVEKVLLPPVTLVESTDRMAMGVADRCFYRNPHRFLFIMRGAYPDFYERLKYVLPDEPPEDNRIFTPTTYQGEYCHMTENPKEYPMLNALQRKMMLPTKYHIVQTPCEQFRGRVYNDLHGIPNKYIMRDQCDRADLPFKVPFQDTATTAENSNDEPPPRNENKRWQKNNAKRRPPYTEYQSTISKTGCIITSNKLNDHRECSDKAHCRHPLLVKCLRITK